MPVAQVSGNGVWENVTRIWVLTVQLSETGGGVVSNGICTTDVISTVSDNLSIKNRPGIILKKTKKLNTWLLPMLYITPNTSAVFLPESHCRICAAGVD